jgi:hypothetical protein
MACYTWYDVLHTLCWFDTYIGQLDSAFDFGRYSPMPATLPATSSGDIVGTVRVPHTFGNNVAKCQVSDVIHVIVIKRDGRLRASTKETGTVHTLHVINPYVYDSL